MKEETTEIDEEEMITTEEVDQILVIPEVQVQVITGARIEEKETGEAHTMVDHNLKRKKIVEKGTKDQGLDQTGERQIEMFLLINVFNPFLGASL